MKIETQRQSDGFDLLTLTSRKGSCLRLSQLGAGMFSFLIEGREMLARPARYEDYAQSRSYYGKFVGPVAGRVKGGILEGEGRTFRLPTNERGNSLHSGSLCYAFAPFSYAVEEKADSAVVKFSSAFPACEDFPARVEASIEYRLFEDEDRIEIEMALIPDSPCPLNPTLHAYYCLGQDSVYPMKLTLGPRKVGVYDEDLLPLGFGENRALDFSLGKAVGEEAFSPDTLPVGGIDHAFLAERKDNKAVLEGKERLLEVSASAPAFQIYATNFPVHNLLLGDGRLDHQGSGITFEPVSRMDRNLFRPAGEPFLRKLSLFFKKGGRHGTL